MKVFVSYSSFLEISLAAKQPWGGLGDGENFPVLPKPNPAHGCLLGSPVRLVIKGFGVW